MGGPREVRYFGDSFVQLVAEAPRLAIADRELEMMATAMTHASIPFLARLTHLDYLRCAGHELGADGCIDLLRALPQLRRFAPWSAKPQLVGDQLMTLLAAPEVARLTELEVLASELRPADRALIASLPPKLRAILRMR